MVKCDVPGVEELAAQSMVGAVVSPAVELVSHDRMARVAHVDADLVRAPGVEVALKEAVALVAPSRLKALERGVGGDGLAGGGVIGHRHAQPVARGARDARDDGSLVVRHVPVNQHHVAAVKHSQADEVLQGLLDLV